MDKTTKIRNKIMCAILPLFLAGFLLFVPQSLANVDTLRIASYSLLNFPGDNSSERIPYFRTVILEMNPDILVVQQMNSQTGVNDFLNDVMNHYQANKYAAAPFVNGPDEDNCLFYLQEKLTFVSNRQIATDLRDVSEYILYFTPLGVSSQFNVYSVDFMTGTGTFNENKRFAESITLRAELNELATNTHFFVCGTFNFYNSTEQGYEMMTGILTDNDGRSFDPINRVGNWYQNAEFADIHSQSTRVLEFGGGRGNGLRKQPTLILISAAVFDGIIHEYLTNSYTTFGNDSLHYLKDVNDGTNQSVADSVADALYYASDHLPVYLDFTVTGDFIPVELRSFNATANNNTVFLSWSTCSESNNYGFAIERKDHKNQWEEIGFISGNGTTSEQQDYSFKDENVKPGIYTYQLKQIDFDGQFEFSNSIQVNIHAPKHYSLSQNYPNPFNNSTKFSFSLPKKSNVKITLFDVLGKNMLVVTDKEYESGTNELTINASNLKSGLYFYKLETADFWEVKKFMVIK